MLQIKHFAIYAACLVVLSTYLVKAQTCPANLCGDGECLVTTHPEEAYRFVCRCKDGTYKYEACKSTTTNNGACASQPCYPNTCLETATSPCGYLCYCGPSDFRPNPCAGTVSSTCQSNSCNNGATCISYSNTNSWCNPFQVGQTCCVCRTGFTGLKCETDIDECSSSPCRNGGVCDNLVNSYSCRCPVGFSGVNCEISAPTTTAKCSPNPCAPNQCFETTGTSSGYVCLCGANDFRPNPCTVTTNGCTSTTCKNGGTCATNADGSFKGCFCAPGWIGTNCESSSVSSNGCSSTKCKNSGTCVTNADGSFKGCFCAPGWIGTFCETASSQSTSCTSLQCQNGGYCQQSGTTAKCTCASGYTGTTCQTCYFKCQSNGRFKDQYGCAAGKYFECVFYGSTNIGLPEGILYVRDCAPTGLRYNPSTDLCDFATNVVC